MADPYPKTRQLARGERRYRRKVASPKQWAAIRADKLTSCRICDESQRIAGTSSTSSLELHHLVNRSQGGDDVADNLVPLCSAHHGFVTNRTANTLRVLAESLTDGEYAYCIEKLGEGAMTRLFGVMRP